MDRRPKVAYVGGWIGKHNLGDEALFDAFRYLFPKLSFLHFDGGRISTRLAKYNSFFRSGFMGGGTLIGGKTGILTVANKFLEDIPDLVIFGTGVETASFWPGESALSDWIPLLQRCRFIGVRGPTSAELLADCGMEQVEIVGDPVLAFATGDINTTAIPNSIGLNIGTSDGRLWGDEERVCDEVARLALIAKKAGWSVEWFVVWPKDLAITYKAAQRSDTASKIHLAFDDYRVFIKKVRPLTAFVGMKLHATVLATCALTPSVMLEYRPKCRDYMRSIGQEASTFRTDTFIAEEIWEIVSFWNFHHDEAANKLLEGIHLLQKKQRLFAEKVTSQVVNR